MSRGMQLSEQRLLLQLVSVAALLQSFSYGLSQDGLTLLEIKSTIIDRKNALSNWFATDHTPCRWTGVSCQAENGRVTSINLPYMQLEGTISPSIGKLSKLQRLAIHRNSIHGNIPHEIGNCTELRAVYLQANNLQGDVPSEIGNLVFLAILDLSSNSLKGAIPSSLGRLTKLRHLNLSTNFFSGEIPDFGALSTFQNKSFLGNLNLCGPQVRKLCRSSLGFPAVLPNIVNEEPSVPRKDLSRYREGIIIGAMCTMGAALTILLAFLFIWLLTNKERAAKQYSKVRKQQVDAKAGTNLITFRGKLSYPSSEIIEKLESLGEEDIVGSGGFGTVYKMVMNDCSIFAVKRIDGDRERSDQMFESELEILGSIKHINLVNIRGYCKFPTSKLLIYDYLANGSLDGYLHARNNDHSNLKWSDRLNIALGSARGLAYLHHDCNPRIVHLDIKSSNILLDENLMPHVSDFGLAKLLVDDEAHMTTVIAGTPGYLAPEYLQNGRATEKSDVYSFGVLLLELVSGKRPTDSCFSRLGLNIVGWLDTSLRDNKLVEIVDVRCRDDADLETIQAIIEIASRCTDANPDARPAMCHVLHLLEGEIASPCPSIMSSESKIDFC